MTGYFEIEPSPYHLGTCTIRVPSDEGDERVCGRAAVSRSLGRSPGYVDGDQRWCEEHAPSLPMRSA